MDKTCRDCLKLLPLSDFPYSSRSPDGHYYYCKKCSASRARAYQAGERKGQRREQRRFIGDLAILPGHKACSRCREVFPTEAFVNNRSQPDGRGSYCRPCHNVVTSANRASQHGSSRNFHLQRRYGIGEAEANDMLDAQDGLCAICRARPADHVDQDHASTRVRSLLCFACNAGLGSFQDSPALLLTAAQYLEAHARSGRWPSPARWVPALVYGWGDLDDRPGDALDDPRERRGTDSAEQGDRDATG